MTRERWQRIRAVIDEAERVPARERGAILDRLCAGDLELRQEVELLMKDVGSDFIQAAIGSAAAEMMEDGAGAASLEHEYTGRRIGSYKLSDLIGSGGMGSVYRGVRDDREFEQQVAVKFLHSGTGEALKERFRQERQTLARLSHPHIARILDGGTTTEGTPYFVMEYIDGEPVTLYCSKHDLPLVRRVELFVEICAAVDYANQKGVIHRDLKPSNILVTPEGLPKLLDFGIAKNVGISAASELTAPELTAPGVIVGSLNYLSPEQARGEPVDARSDVFSLGVILYELLTGVEPFARPTAGDTLAAILVESPPRPGQVQAGVPRELDAVAVKALAKSRDARYATAGEMLADLKMVHLDLAAKARRRPRLTRLGLWAASLTAALTVALFLWAPWRHAPAALSDVQVQKLTNLGDVSLAAITRDGKYIVTASPNTEIWVRQVATGAAKLILPAPSRIQRGLWTLRVSADGNFVYYVVNTDATLYRIPILGGEPEKILDHGGAPAFSPDGKSMAAILQTGTAAAVIVADLNGANIRTVLTEDPKTADITQLYWTPDGRDLLFVRRDGTTSKWEIWSIAETGGHPHRILTTSFGEITDVMVLPSGTLVLCASLADATRDDTQIWLAREGRIERLTNDLNAYLLANLTAQGEIQSVAMSGHGQLWYGPVQGPLRPITYGTLDYTSASWTREGRVIASVRVGGAWQIRLFSPDDAEQRVLLQTDVPLGRPSACENGQTILYPSGRIGEQAIWRIDSMGRQSARVTTGVADWAPVCAPDGKSLFYRSMREGRLQMCRAPLPSGAPDCFDIADQALPFVSPDGKWLAYGILGQSSDMQQKTRVRPLGEGQPKTLNIRGPLLAGFTADSRALFYREGPRRDQIWVAPLDGSAPKLFADLQITGLGPVAVSPDGKWLLSVQPNFTSDVVLFRGVR